MSILEKLAERTKLRRMDAQQKYVKLAQDIAAGNEPAIESVEVILAEAGKTAGELAATVERQRERIAARRQLEEAESLIATKDRVIQDLNAAQAKLDEAQARYDDASAPLLGQLELISQATVNAARLRATLRDTAPEDLLAQSRELHSRTSALSTEIAQLKERAAHLRNVYEHPEKWGYEAHEYRASLAADAPEKLRIAAEKEARVVELEKKLRSLEKEAAKLETTMLKL